jgi:hypothetical protein
VRVNRESNEIFERTHHVCFHSEFEHMGFDRTRNATPPGAPRLRSTRRLPTPRRHRAETAVTTTAPRSRSQAHRPRRRAASSPRTPAFQELDVAELSAMVPCAAESVLRRGRAVMELGRRAANDPALLTKSPP